VEALALGVQTSLVQGTADSVAVALATQVASQLPSDGAGFLAKEGVLEDAAGAFHCL
jgi:hypothetical protein